MNTVQTSAEAYANLLDIEYQIVLGRKNKTIAFSIIFEEAQFFHLAGLHYLTDRNTTLFGDRTSLFQKILHGTITANEIESSQYYQKIKDRIEYLAFLEQIMDSNKTVFKYNPQIQTFSVIQSDFLLKNEINARNVFTFLSLDKSSGKYFCRSFFPQTDKDYSKNQTNWTLLYKKKIKKSTNEGIILYDVLKK